MARFLFGDDFRCFDKGFSEHGINCGPSWVSVGWRVVHVVAISAQVLSQHSLLVRVEITVD